MKYLDKSASIGDVISWIIAIPAFTAITAIIPYMYFGVIPKFKFMYSAVRGKIKSDNVVFAFDNSDLLYLYVPIVLTVIIVTSLIAVKSHPLRIAILSISNLALWLNVAYGSFAIYVLCLELRILNN